jgi:hypothetical protein
MIFFKATKAPVFLDRARWTSLSSTFVSWSSLVTQTRPRGAVWKLPVPESALAQLSLKLIVRDARASVEASFGAHVVESECAGRCTVGRALERSLHDVDFGTPTKSTRE